jgi:hypothetical protein
MALDTEMVELGVTRRTTVILATTRCRKVDTQNEPLNIGLKLREWFGANAARPSPLGKRQSRCRVGEA